MATALRGPGGKTAAGQGSRAGEAPEAEKANEEPAQEEDVAAEDARPSPEDAGLKVGGPLA